MKLFELHRQKDPTGVSGTGIVAQGVIFNNGWCVLNWLTAHRSIAVYESIDEVIAIHGHDGQSHIIQVCDYNAPLVKRLVTNEHQDNFENVSVDFTSKNHSYVWDQREQFSRLFDEVELKRSEKPSPPPVDYVKKGL